MACDCGCTETSIECTCPPPIIMEGPSLAYVAATTFDGTPVDIYNGALGYTLLIYTNTTSTNQFILIDSNAYITSDATQTLTTQYYVNSIGTLDGSGTMTYALASSGGGSATKTSVTHPSGGIVLAPGKSYWIHLTSTDPTAKAVHLTSFVYIWNF